VDSWASLHPDRSDARKGFTFPTCNPVKRIDYIFVRNHSLPLSEEDPQQQDKKEGERLVRIVPVDSFLIGQEPTEDTREFFLSLFFVLLFISFLSYES
jgi:hypothetical protein